MSVTGVDQLPNAASPIKHAEREFPTEGQQVYVLPHDDLERGRLILQHGICTRLFGRIILPPVSFVGDESILDSGTGTGTWVLDAAKLVPSSVELYGTDIGSRLWPTIDSVPNNVHFSINSILNLPKDWDNKFALVHQRLLIGALRFSDWQIACKEIYRTTAPGGWVQLTEMAPWRLTSFGGGPCVRRVISMLLSVFKKIGLVMEITEQLPDLLREVGFIDVKVEEGRPRPTDFAAQEEGRRNTMTAMRALKTSVLNMGALGYIGSEEEFDSLMDAMEDEIKELPEGTLVFVSIYARKPDSSDL